ncbi:DNA circularization protein [Trabulsiella odontotermitis]|uniref:DNA circularization protein n=1 Tax=Trabulsiella odontotermitis TaxID=379893 RepID=UPI00067616E3|nr:DNA circularization N-terminal domain-containing protein [Trabulsiella odontotermitis]KNC92531.1 multidrug DMT transporter permease [Trabulsiella odontotermitis]
MGWAENLQNASYKGVIFDVTKTREQNGRDHAEYTYPHVDGGDLKDLGRKPRQFSLTAILWGDSYEYKLQQLTAALDEPGGGELIHPIYGSFPSVLALDYTVDHDAENPDSCTVELSFLENRTGTALFSTALPEMFGSSLFDKLDALTSKVADFFAAVTAPLNTVNSLIKRARIVESTLMNTLLTFDDDVSHTTAQLTSLAGTPGQFIQELSEVLEIHTANVASAVPALAVSVVETVTGQTSSEEPEVASSSTVAVNWNRIVSDMDELVTLPESFISGDVTPEIPYPTDASLADVQDVRAAYAVAAVTELASAATAILSDDDQSAQLTPDSIEQLVDDVRTRIQSTIDLLRIRYEPDRELITETSSPVGIAWLDLVEDLKTVALSLQDLGLMVLSRRPPLIRRRVDADSCLLLLAHLWYADYSRVSELVRLNPQISEPNRITAGMVLNAYAK